MPGLTLQFHNVSQVSEALAVKLRYVSLSAEEAFVEEGRKFANDLYNVTADIAPSKAKITADVKALGWRIPRFFKGGRLGRGLPRMWADFAFATQQRGRGRPKKGQGKDAARAARPTLAQMQKFVIQMRCAARLYLASGWLGAVEDLGGAPKNTSGRVSRARGGAEVIRGHGKLIINLWNHTEGIVAQDAKHRLVAKAAALRAADMWIYILRKMREAGESLGKAA